MTRVLALLLLPGLGAACRPPGAPPATTCDVAFTDEGDARVFAIAHRFSLDDAHSYATFEASWLRHLDRIRPCLSTTRPNVVTFPEDAGLIAWFIGRQALFGRNAASTGDAFNAIYAQTWRQADEYRRRFPGTSVAQGLTLALSDRAWRAVHGTFSRFAKEAGAWVVTSANLPYAERVLGGPDAAFFADPEGDGSAWVARSPEVFNAGLVYAPSGELVFRTDKAYLVPTENDDLDMTNGPLSSLRVAELPFGRLGIAISRDAFYPPFAQRLDDLGASLVVQPEAFSGWAREQQPGDWLPDVYLASGWAMNQKHGAVTHTVGPILTGNLLDADFDCQAQVTGHADGRPGQHFIGQAPLPGLELVGAWAFEEDVTRPLEERRAWARAEGRKLLPGGALAGQYHDGFIAADLRLPGDRPRPVVAVTEEAGRESWPVDASAAAHQRNAAVAFDGAGRLYVAFEDARGGTPQVRLAVSDDGGRTFSSSEAVASSLWPQRRPHVAAQGEGRVVVAWQDGAPGLEHVRVAHSDNGGVAFEVVDVERFGGAQWEPQVALDEAGTAWVAWVDFGRGLVPEVRVASMARQAARFTASCAVDSSTRELPRVRASQLQPALVAHAGRVGVAWVDYREEDWQLYARVEVDLCAASAATRVSPDSAAEVLASSPAWAAAPDGRLLLAWDEMRDRVGVHDVRAAEWSGGAWRVLDALPRARAPRSWPAPSFHEGRWSLVIQDAAPRRATVARVALDGAGRLEAPVRLDGTGDAPLPLLRPRAAAHPTHGQVVVFDDARDGYRRLRALRP